MKLLVICTLFIAFCAAWSSVSFAEPESSSDSDIPEARSHSAIAQPAIVPAPMVARPRANIFWALFSPADAVSVLMLPAVLAGTSLSSLLSCCFISPIS